MKIKSNLHTHTLLSDGNNPVERMIEVARDLGFVSLGISDHSPIEEFEKGIGSGADAEEKYAAAVRKAAESAEGKLDVFCGLELDYFSECKRELYDYVIGSVHLIEHDGIKAPIDWSQEVSAQIKRDFYGGDDVKFAEAYYKLVFEHARRNVPDIIGHYDLITLCGQIDETNPRYIETAVGYVSEIMKYCSRFEVNTGGMSRGHYRPYPARPILEEILRLGGTVIPSSDAHRSAHLAYKFDEVEELLRSVGFKTIDRLTKDGFVADPI